MKNKRIPSVQEWIPLQEILDNGIIKLKNNQYVKILKVKPINFNLKSELEKDAILNSYKNFLKTCPFSIQILIQSNKEDLSQNISKIKSQEKNENEKLKKIAEEYIQYIEELNKTRKSANKNFYIIIKKEYLEQKEKIENIIIEELNDQYFKIKESLARCGNIVQAITEKEKIEELLFSFLNNRIYFEIKK